MKPVDGTEQRLMVLAGLLVALVATFWVVATGNETDVGRKDAARSEGAGMDMLTNGDFEGDYRIGLAPGWGDNTWGDNPAPSRNFSRADGRTDSSAFAQQIDVNSLGNGGVLYFQDIDIIAGHTYEASVWLRSSNSVKVQVNLRRPDNYYQAGASQTLVVGPTWQKVTIKGGFSDGTKGQFVIDFKSSGTLWVDDASLKDVTASIDSAPIATTTAIPSTFFGMHVNKLGEHQYWPPLDQGLVRLWSTATTWADLEPTQDEWDWMRLDLYVDYVKNNNPNADLLYTMGISPSWSVPAESTASSDFPGESTEPPADLEDWRNYVRELGQRYKGEIKYWEIWNEADHSEFYTGDIETMIEMTRIARQELKAIDSGNVILAPNITDVGLSWLDEFLHQGGGQYVDVISLHNYPSATPENDIPEYIGVQNVMENHGIGDKPLWNTEGASSGGAALAEDQVRGAVARAYLTQWVQGIGNFSWYAWDIHEDWAINLSTDELESELTSGGEAYQETAKGLVGAWVVSKSVEDDGKRWIIEIQRPGGYVGYIVWRTEGSESFVIPSSWGAVTKRHLAGGTSKVEGGTSVQIGPAPILLETVDPPQTVDLHQVGRV